MSDAIILDTPAQINSWQFMSLVSALSLELKTGMRHSRGGSALKAAQRWGITSVTGNATKKNLALCLAEVLHEQPSGPVVDLARKTLQEVLDTNGWVITLA